MAKCMTQGCHNSAHSRGLCLMHYQHVRRLVAAGKATWKDLEAQGRVKPDKRIIKSDAVKCLTPDCPDAPQHRGLCLSHYRSARRLVALGKTTWEALGAQGVVGPRHRIKLDDRNFRKEGAEVKSSGPREAKPKDPLASKTINQSLKYNTREGFALAYLDAWAKLYSPDVPIEEKRLWPPDPPIYVPAQFRKEEETKCTKSMLK